MLARRQDYQQITQIKTFKDGNEPRKESEGRLDETPFLTVGATAPDAPRLGYCRL